MYVLRGVPKSFSGLSCNAVFPIKDARFSQLKDISDILCDDREGNIVEMIEFTYFGRLLWETLIMDQRIWDIL